MLLQIPRKLEKSHFLSAFIWGMLTKYLGREFGASLEIRRELQASNMNRSGDSSTVVRRE